MATPEQIRAAMAGLSPDQQRQFMDELEKRHSEAPTTEAGFMSQAESLPVGGPERERALNMAVRMGEPAAAGRAMAMTAAMPAASLAMTPVGGAVIGGVEGGRHGGFGGAIKGAALGALGGSVGKLGELFKFAKAVRAYRAGRAAEAAIPVTTAAVETAAPTAAAAAKAAPTVSREAARAQLEALLGNAVKEGRVAAASKEAAKGNRQLAEKILGDLQGEGVLAP